MPDEKNKETPPDSTTDEINYTEQIIKEFIKQAKNTKNKQSLSTNLELLEVDETSSIGKNIIDLPISLESLEPVEIPFGYRDKMALIAVDPETVIAAVGVAVNIIKMFVGGDDDIGAIKRGLEQIGKWVTEIKVGIASIQAGIDKILDELEKLNQLVADIDFTIALNDVRNYVEQYFVYLPDWQADNVSELRRRDIKRRLDEYEREILNLLRDPRYLYGYDVGLALRVHVDLMILARSNSEVKTDFLRRYRAYFDNAANEKIKGSVAKLLKDRKAEKANLEKKFPPSELDARNKPKPRVLEVYSDYYERYTERDIVRVQVDTKFFYVGDLADDDFKVRKEVTPYDTTQRRRYTGGSPRSEGSGLELPLRRTQAEVEAIINDKYNSHRIHVAEASDQYRDLVKKISQLKPLMDYTNRMRKIISKLQAEWATIDPGN